MLDPKRIRNEPERIKTGVVAKKHDPATVDRWLELDAQRREAVQAVETIKADRNQASKAIGEMKKAGGDASAEMERVRKLGEDIQTQDDRIRTLDEQLNELAIWFPNPPHESVPVGGEDQNVVTRTWGEPRPKQPKDHADLAESLGLIDFARGARMSGQGFAVMTGPGARLRRALTAWMLDLHREEHGFTEMAVPYLVKRETMFGTGQLPKLESDMYRIESDDMFLIPTAEVSVTNIHQGDVLPEEDLPLYYVAESPCFRREAGSYGRDTRGITRVHQFDKVEMVKFVHPDRSYEELETLVANAERVLQLLDLPYRVLTLASGDLSFAAAKCYDLEVWAPGADRWLEVSSCSNFEDFQARRANIRYKPTGGGKTEYVHTLNGSGLALPRTIIAVLENYQTGDGGVRVPKVIRPYLGGLEELR